MKKYLFLAILILGVLLYFCYNSNHKKKNVITEVKDVNTKLISENGWLRNHISLIQKAATEKTIKYEEKIGFMSKEYSVNLTKWKLLLLKAQGSVSDTVYIKEEDLLTITKDSLKTSDLSLYYRIEVLGMLKAVSFDYKVNEKVITERKIIYQDKFIDKPVLVWTPKTQLNAFAIYGIKNHSLELGLNLLTKKRIGVIGSYEYLYINSTNYSNFKAGISYRIF